MLLKYSGILKTVMIAILFCSLAFGQNSNTTLIGRWANGPCYAVEVVDNIAYFGNGGYLEIVDISDPANPIELGKVLNPSVVLGIAVSGSYVYVADGGAGLRIIDVSTPSSPVEAGFFDTGSKALGVAVSGDVVYVADDGDGMYIIRNDLLMGINEESSHLPENFLLAPNYPNPFNPITTISYQLPKSAFVNLSIYNITGQLVETVVNDYKTPGFYTVEWNDREVGSGIYFYKITAGEFTDVRKCLLVK